MSRTEADTRAELIDPELAKTGWGTVEGSRIRREFTITNGRIQGKGKKANAEFADYVLIYRNQILAVLEAKHEGLPVTEGLAQAKKYSEKLHVRFAYSSNGKGLYRVDLETGEEGDVSEWPTPDQLWNELYPPPSTADEESRRFWQDQFSSVPFEDRSGQWEPRYYQQIAIHKTMEAVAKGRDRILLTLATGTGKTAIAFQIAWKLFHSRWNLNDWREGISEEKKGRRPRILFLADRNILASQAFNSFSAFPEDALVRIKPNEIRKKGKVPKNGNLFFTIFQTFMSGDEDDKGNTEPYFGDYPPDYFDFIIIDECHRGGANDESSWRGILEYFSPAVQLGLTATPKRKHNADTYAYFGEPIYVYSLKEGINDGFLTPFRVKQIQTTLDEYVYTSDDDVVEGEVIPGKRYKETDFNLIIEIKEREKNRVKILMESINQQEKTLVFCATQDHALAVRDLINQMKSSDHPNYCERVTANDGKIGEQFLEQFQDNEKTIPTVLTTSRKLSTGVDARNVRNIVLLRPVKSMIEFKQIIGRGTRLFDGKYYFTIYDFVKAYELFSDPEWDGEPMNPEPPKPKKPTINDEDDDLSVKDNGDDYEKEKPKKLVIKLADGKERQIQHMTSTSFWSPDGTPMSSAEFMEALFGTLPEFFKDEEELRNIWGDPETRKRLLENLEEKNFGREGLHELQLLVEADNCDLFDVLCYVAFASEKVTRKERATRAKIAVGSNFDDQEKAFIEFVLGHYIKEGVDELDEEKLSPLLTLKYRSLNDAKQMLGDPGKIRSLFRGFQKYLYGRGIDGS